MLNLIVSLQAFFPVEFMPWTFREDHLKFFSSQNNIPFLFSFNWQLASQESEIHKKNNGYDSQQLWMSAKKVML